MEKKRWLNSSIDSSSHRTNRDIRDYIKVQAKISKGSTDFVKRVLGASQSNIEGSKPNSKKPPEPILEQPIPDDFITKMKRKEKHSRRATVPTDLTHLKNKTLPASCITRGVRKKKSTTSQNSNPPESSSPRNKENSPSAHLQRKWSMGAQSCLQENLSSSSLCVLSDSELCHSLPSASLVTSCSPHKKTTRTPQSSPPPLPSFPFTSTSPDAPTTTTTTNFPQCIASSTLSPSLASSQSQEEGSYIDTNELLAELSYCEKIKV